MDKYDLIKYKSKLSKLSQDEQKLRQLYLRELAKGNLNKPDGKKHPFGPMVGYPGIDVPQTKDYSDDFLDLKLEKTYAEVHYSNNSDNLDTTALDYFHSKISFDEYNKMTEDLVKALAAVGTKEGQSVGVCLPGIPEAMASLRACAHLGAIGLYMVPYLDKKQMISDFKKDNTKTLIIMDMIYEKAKPLIDEVAKEVGMERIVVVPTLNSSILGKFKRQPKLDDPNLMYYNDFIKIGENTPLPSMVKYKPKMPLAVVYTSGTSGILKGVLLSHDSFINIPNSYRAFGFDFRRGQVIYQAIPAWTSTGLITVGSNPLFFGETVFEDPRFNPRQFALNLLLHKITWGVGTTDLYIRGLKELLDEPFYRFLIKLGILNLKDLDTVHIGGSYSSTNDVEELKKLLYLLGSNATPKRGYGRCEDGSIDTAELNGVDYPDGSVGTPIPGVTIIAVDEEGHELPYNTRGELAIKNDNGMISYYNRPDLDAEAFFKEEGSGYIFGHSGDVGYVRPDGIIIYEGREKDHMMVNGDKIYYFDVKKALFEDKDIFDCEALSNKDGELCAHIVFRNELTDGLNNKLKEIQDYIFEKYQNENYVPKHFKIRKDFPIAASTKRDYTKLKEEDGPYIYVPYTSNSLKLKI